MYVLWKHLLARKPLGAESQGDRTALERVRQKALLLKEELEAGTNVESETAGRRTQVVNWNVNNK
jgi:hypothetical protein